MWEAGTQRCNGLLLPTPAFVPTATPVLPCCGPLSGIPGGSLRVALRLPRRAAAGRGWLRLLLAALLFSAAKGWLGALFVASVAAGPVTQICTSAGMQWVALEAVTSQDDTRSDAEDASALAVGLQGACVWAMALAALPESPPVVQVALQPSAWGEAPRPVDVQPPLAPASERVLLSSPMRAPPLQLA